MSRRDDYRPPYNRRADVEVIVVLAACGVFALGVIWAIFTLIVMALS